MTIDEIIIMLEIVIAAICIFQQLQIFQIKEALKREKIMRRSAKRVIKAHINILNDDISAIMEEIRLTGRFKCIEKMEKCEDDRS